MRILSVLFFATLLLSTKADVAFNKGKVVGKITIPENVPLLKRGSNQKYCEEEPLSARKKQIDQENHPNRHIVVSFHPTDFTPELKPSANAIMNQMEKTFVPKVLPITKGSSVAFLNSDTEVHNIFSMTPRATFNIGRRQPGKSVPQLIEKAGVVDLKCDIHCGMNASILSLDTPYFTKANTSGNYEVDGLPDGNYRVQVYHFSLGVVEDNISIKGGGVITKNLALVKP
ncbi:hypothetical protein [Haliscomenobacter sp.]|uniref:hypothetical protein n=1 Tax=Haliscomenobacter sp. TaxID=2717303 RepID=UPI003593438F